MKFSDFYINLKESFFILWLLKKAYHTFVINNLWIPYDASIHSIIIKFACYKF